MDVRLGQLATLTRRVMINVNKKAAFRRIAKTSLVVYAFASNTQEVSLMDRRDAIAWTILALLIIGALFRYEPFIYDNETYKRDRFTGDVWFVAFDKDIPIPAYGQTAESMQTKRDIVTSVHYAAIFATAAYILWPIISKLRRPAGETESRLT